MGQAQEFNCPTCPRCEKVMRLGRIEPHPERRADIMTFECACSYIFKETIERAGAQPAVDRETEALAERVTGVAPRPNPSMWRP